MRRPSVFRLALSLCVLSLASMMESSHNGPLVAVRAGVPADWLEAAGRRITQEEYEVTWQTETPLKDLPSAWHAPNRAHNLRTYFTEEGIRVIPRTGEAPSWEWGLTLARHGTRGRERKADRAVVRPYRNRVEYDRGAVLEWYENSPRGLEQAFTILERHDQGAGALSVALLLHGTLSPVPSEDGQAIDFVTPSGARAVHYAELEVTDAAGTALSARMEGLNEEGARLIRIVVEDSGAIYPVTIDPLATSPVWTVEGDQAGALFGAAVATAGDVNGDGFSDVIVGSSFFDNGQPDEGRAYVYLGSASGPATSPAWMAEGDQANAQFGISVSTAGDIDGDGYSDVVVGARYFDNGQIDEGRVCAYMGSPSGLAGTAAWTAEPDQAGAMFGVSVSTAGDVNGDGHSEVIVGARHFDNGQSNEGGAFLYMGSSSGLAGSPMWTAEGNQDAAYFGNSVSLAGDVNADGYSDVIVGAYGYDNVEVDEGRVYLYLGAPGGMSAAPTWTAESNQAGANLGWSVSTAGDVDGDGFADVLVGSRYHDSTEIDEGRVSLYHGYWAGLYANPFRTLEGGQAGANFGWAVAPAGDVNGDGYADVLVGAPYHDANEINEGRSYVYLGSGTGLAPTSGWSAESDQEGANFGMALATAGDVNGDGFSDVITGARAYDDDQADEGRASIYLGSGMGLAAGAGWIKEGNAASASFGSVLATAGDVNGDGLADLIIGAPGYDGGDLNEGLAMVFLGSAIGPDTSPSWTAEGDQADAAFGTSVAAAGDVNRDGYEDVIVGAPGFDNGQANEGRAFVYLGASSGLAATAVWTAEGDQPNAAFGSSVSGAGDVNGGGYGDVIIGAPGYSNGEPLEGRAVLYQGSVTGPRPTPGWTAEGDRADAAFGSSVSAAGDVNGDGYSDVIVGARFSGLPGGGSAHVYHGSAWGLESDPAWSVEDVLPSAEFGSSVATAGDVNGDGYSDVIIGAPGDGSGQQNEGLAYVYHGSVMGLGEMPSWYAQSDQEEARLGSSVATAGDVNGDGYSDVVVGSESYDVAALSDAGRAHVYHGSASGLEPSPAWTANGAQAGALLGAAVGTAGDVNGDGYSDVILGAPGYANGQTLEGRAVLHYGNGGRGSPVRPRQRRADDTGPIAAFGLSDATDSFLLTTTGRTPFGRGRVRVRWQARPPGALFGSTGIQEPSEWSWTSLAFTDVSVQASGRTPGVSYHWRMKLRYDPATLPFQPGGRWLTGWWNGQHEPDLRTRWSAEVSVAISDTPDPMIVGGADLNYVIGVRNHGPGIAPVRIVQTLPSGVSPISVTPEQGVCVPSGSTVACDLGDVGAGLVEVSEVLRPGIPGTLITTVAVQVPVYVPDSDPNDDTASEQTQALGPAAGDRIWLDQDGDGIQEAGEPGFSGAAVGVYESASGAPVDGALSNLGGLYQVTGLTFGATYYLVFFPPLAYVLTAGNQGTDDTLDSDADAAIWRTPEFTFTSFDDFTRWDAGVYPACLAPDQTIDLAMVTLSTGGSDFPILHLVDQNPASHVTGCNVYRSGSANLPHGSWPMVESDVIDVDAGTPNIQWIDDSGAPPPGGIWYYSVTAYNHRCPAEGPW